MRLQITFPSQYPTIPPTVTLLTDMFHPLVTPLTTYMYSTDIQEGGTVSATDDERLPPGGFSLRHGFPKWFGRGSRSAASSRQVSAQHRTTDADTIHGQDTPGRRATVSPKHIIPPTRPTIPYGHSISIYEILKYLRSAFDNEGILDSIPLEAAGNPGAWHAWRAHQISLGRTLPPAPDTPEASDEQSDTDISSSAPEGYHRVQGGLSPRSPARKPREWNWEGVWEVRARRDIEKSVADSTLYGGTTNNDEMVITTVFDLHLRHLCLHFG